MRPLKKSLTVIAFLLLSVALTQFAFANGRGRDDNDYRDRRSYYRQHRYYPKSYYYYRKIYYYPRRTYYYYYDVYPERRYYYGWEKPYSVDNPDYIPVTSIANMAAQGVPDAVIISEIERTRSKYKLDTDTITYLQQNGVSDAVIDYMLETSR